MQREGGFRLDDRESALGEADSGEHPIVPGDLDSSELYQRLISDDPDMRMPPEDTNKTLTEEEIAKIGQWIRRGAAWLDRHWSFRHPLSRHHQRYGNILLATESRLTISCSPIEVKSLSRSARLTRLRHYCGGSRSI